MKKFLLVAMFFVLLSGLAFSATSWYMPEGSTDGFALWILITNPNSSDADVTYTFYTLNNGTYTYSTTVAANSRSNLDVNYRLNALAGASIADAVSTKVECTNGLNVYAERSMYWPYGSQWVGGHTSRAVSGLEGCYNEIGQPSSFPITISTPGSYKLIGNIACSTQDVNAIEITTDDVTLDLNGFAIVGPTPASGNTGNGISIGATRRNITIKNGIIKSFSGNGISVEGGNTWDTLNYNIDINNIKFWANGGWGTYLVYVYGGVVKDCFFTNNGTTVSDTGGVKIAAYCTCINNTVVKNTGNGITAAGYDIVRGNFVNNNSGKGIYIASYDGSYIDNNNVIANTGTDIDLNNKKSKCIMNTYGNSVTWNAHADDIKNPQLENYDVVT